MATGVVEDPRSRRRVPVVAVLALVTAVLAVGPWGADAAPAPAPRCDITGTPGPDVLVGGPGADVICGFGGNDRIFGGGGKDLLKGGPGDDVLKGGRGADVVKGGRGSDSLGGGRGDDVMRGGRGNDTLSGRDAARFRDVLDCGPGRADRGTANPADVVRRNCEQVRQNRPPTDVTLSPAAIAENEQVGTLVGRLSATDPNPRDTHTFLLVSGPGSSDNDSFTLDGRSLLTASVFDFETDDELSIRVRATDREGATREKRLTVTVTDVNEPPVAVDDTFSTAEDTSLDLPVTGPGSPAANDTDPDGDSLNVTAVAAATGGTVSISAGTIHFTPADDECGDAAGGFEYTVADGNGGTDSGQVTVDVSCVADHPTARDDAASVLEDSGPNAIGVLANDTDPDGDFLQIGSVTQPTHGSVVITGGGTGLAYVPNGGYCNQPGGTRDTFTYTLTPGGSTATVSVAVTCVDDAPAAVDDSLTVAEDAPATAVDVLANDTDPDGGPKSVVSVTQPGDGTVAVTGGGTGLTYEPDADYCNAPPGGTPDTFTYTLNGGSTATVGMTVTCVSDAPVVGTGGTLIYNEGDGLTPIAPGLTVTDVDSTELTGATVEFTSNHASPQDELLFTNQSGITGSFNAATGTLTLTGTATISNYQTALRSVSYRNTSAMPSTLTREVTFTATDDTTLEGSGTRDIEVVAVDDDPTAVDDTETVAEDPGATTVDVLANDTDPDAGPISVESVTQPANGTVAITGAGASLTYEPDADYCNDPPGASPDTFTYTLNGGSTGTVSVTVTCVADWPTAVDDSATVDEDAAATAIDVLANDTDPDGGPISVDVVTQPTNGSVVITGGGSGLTYQPDPDYCNTSPATGPDTFTYELNGGSVGEVSVTVTCADDAPVAVDDDSTVAEDTAAAAIDVLTNDTDTDGGPKTIASASDPANGTVVITGGGTGLTYEPDADYCNDPGAAGVDTFTYTLNGGSTGTVSMTVTCVDDDPVAVDDSATVAVNDPATAIDVLANDTDVDAGPKTIASASDPANGTVVITGGGTGLTYEPDPGYCIDPGVDPDDTFTYTLAPGGATATVSVTVPCDVPPTAVDDTPTVAEDAAATAIDVLANDTDPDGGPKTVESVTQPTNGTVAITGGGTGLTYQPDPDYCNDPPGTTPDTFTYELNGGSTATVSITLTCVDDAPSAVSDSATVLEDAAAAAVDVLTNDTDTDAGPKTIDVVTQPTNGTVAITGGGSGLTYQPDADYCNDPPGTTPDTFTYTLNGGSEATVSMTVTCVNDAPTADDETFDGTQSAIGNTTLVGDDPTDGAPTAAGAKKTVTGDILDGDTDPDGPGPLVVTAGTFPTNDGGSVLIESDGDFTFTPAAATSCTDTSDFFDYTVSDQDTPTAGTDTGRVTIAISGCVWYVSNNAAGDSGTSTAPFDTLAQAETASGVDHTIYVFDGDNTTTGYNAGIDLKAGQRLIGEVATLQVGGHVLLAANAGARPTITDANADVVALDDGNTVRGLHLDPSGAGGGIAGGSGDTGGGTIDDVRIIDGGTAGTQPGLELNGTTGTFNVSDLTIDNKATGVLLNNAGTVNFAAPGTISITTVGAKALDATGTAMGSGSVFDDITATGSGAGGVSMTNTTGTTTFSSLSLTTTSGPTAAFLLNNAGSVTVDAGGVANVSATGGPAVDVTGTGGAVLTFDDVDSANSTGDGINLAGLGTGTFTANSSSTITNAAGVSFDLDGGSGAITYDGTINDDALQLVRITNTNGGLKDLNGAITDGAGNGGGILLTSNGASTVRFDGGLTLVTGTSPAFMATGGGTVVVTDPAGAPNNTVASTTGTALNVSSTTIGSGGLTFERISANGAANAIVLNSTGSSAGLTVTGDGGTTNNGSGGVIQNSTGTGILLTTTANVDLSRMNVQGGADTGIRGTGVTGFRLNRSNVTGNGNSTSDDGIRLGDPSGNVIGVTGAVSILDSSISGNAHNNVHVRNTSGTITSFTVTGSSFNNLNDTHGANAFLVEASGASVIATGAISGSTFQNNGPQRALEVQAHDTGTIGSGSNALTVSGNTFVDNGIHASFTQDTASSLRFRFVNNGSAGTPMTGSLLQAVNVFSSSQATGGTIVGTISGNVIGNAGVALSGSTQGGGISAVLQGQTDATLLIDGNTIRQTNGDARAVAVAFRGPAPPLASSLGPNTVVSDVTVTNNNVVPGAAPSGFPLSTIVIEADNQTGSDAKAPTVRADVRGNTVPTTPVFDFADAHLIFYEYDAAGGHGIGQLVDTAPADANATAQLAGNNTGTVFEQGISLIAGPIGTP